MGFKPAMRRKKPSPTSEDEAAVPSRFDIVLRMASFGMRLHPCKPRSKEAILKGWPDKATTDPAQLQTWNEEYPNCNWGGSAGEQSGLLVIDTDSEEALALFKGFGPVPSTLTVKTARGWHFYFQYPKGMKIKNSSSTLGLKIDVKAERGNIIVPPSVHPSGAIYKIVDDCPPAPVPEWLLKRLLQIQSPSHSSSDSSAKAKEDGAKRIQKGKRNDTLIKMAGAMHRKGMPPDAIASALQITNSQECDPPLGLREVQKIAESIERYPSESDSEENLELMLAVNRNADLVVRAERLLQRPEERIFQTVAGRKLVRVIKYSCDPTSNSFIQRDPESSILTEVTPQYIQFALGLTGKVWKPGKKNPLPADVPRQLADMILSKAKTAPEKTAWKLIKKISQTPVLLSDGTLVMAEDYNENSRIWIDFRGIEFRDLALDPRLSSEKCASLIGEHVYPFLSRYRFFCEEVGQKQQETGAYAVVLSAMMCIDDRHNLPIVPMHCVSAPAQSCGKTRLVQAISAAVTGLQPTIVTYDGAEEFAKHLPALLANGDNAICIDNVRQVIDNEKMAAMITQENPFNNRPLGKSETVAVDNVSVLLATGVNLQLSGDMPSRSLRIRIEPGTEHPELARFPFDPIERARELFPNAVMAIKALLRAHQLHGYPGRDLLDNESRFRAWDRRVRSAIVWAGFADPLKTQEIIRAEDPVRSGNIRILWTLRRYFRDKPFLTCEIKSKLTDEEAEVFMQRTGHRTSEHFNETKLGNYLADHLCDRWYEGIRLVRTGRVPKGRVEWRIESKKSDADFGIQEEAL